MQKRCLIHEQTFNFNEPVKSVRKSQQTIHSMFWNSLIQMIRLERVSSELNSSKNREILWARARLMLRKVTNVEF